jgi:hypothetical protein
MVGDLRRESCGLRDGNVRPDVVSTTGRRVRVLRLSTVDDSDERPRRSPQ